jgi:hypothetical protein
MFLTAICGAPTAAGSLLLGHSVEAHRPRELEVASESLVSRIGTDETGRGHTEHDHASDRSYR